MKFSQDEEKQFANLKRRLSRNWKITRYNYRGERTIIVLPGLSFEQKHLEQIEGLLAYEERLLFFLFLLRFKRTKIIYVSSVPIKEQIIDYYLDMLTDDKNKQEEMKNRLYNISVSDKNIIPLTKKVLSNNKVIKKIKSCIDNYKTTCIQCYSSTLMERKLSVKLDVPLYTVDTKLRYYGTKSGARKIFRLAKTNVIPGYENIKTLTQLYKSIADLMKKYPHTNRLMIKLERSAAGRGNCIFDSAKFRESNDLDISIETDLNKLTTKIRNQFCHFARPQYHKKCKDYLADFKNLGGIVERFITAENFFSPSIRLQIGVKGHIQALSNHEQILGGLDKQSWIGGAFPINDRVHRKALIKKSLKIAKVLVKKGVIGTFSVDYVTIYKKNSNEPIIYPIEINLRKGGTTHPFYIALSITGAKYSPKEAMLFVGKQPIYYCSYDIIKSPQYKKLSQEKLIDLIGNSKLNFNKEINKGVVVFMSGMIKKYGKFGAICIEHSGKKAKALYKKLIKLIDSHTAKKN